MTSPSDSDLEPVAIPARKALEWADRPLPPADAKKSPCSICGEMTVDGAYGDAYRYERHSVACRDAVLDMLRPLGLAPTVGKLLDRLHGAMEREKS